MDDNATLAHEIDLARRLYRLGPDVREALLELVAKAERGHEKHGALALDTDPRDFRAEREDELLDAVWYGAFEIRRLKRRIAQLEGLMVITYDAPETER